LFMAPGMDHCGGWRGSICLRHGRRLIAMGRARQSTGVDSGRTLTRRPRRTDPGQNPAPVCLSASCQVQGDRQHRRCIQFRLHETMISGNFVFAVPGKSRGKNPGSTDSVSEIEFCTLYVVAERWFLGSILRFMHAKNHFSDTLRRCPQVKRISLALLQRVCIRAISVWSCFSECHCEANCCARFHLLTAPNDSSILTWTQSAAADG
jgi:hypothetical protein